MNSFVLLAYASLAASRTLLQWLLACLNFTLESEDFLLVQSKKVISMNYGSSTSSWKPWRWVRLDLILWMRDIYINSNLNSQKLAAAKALSLRANVCNNLAIGESDHLRIARFSYILVSFMKEKHQKNFFWKILFHTGFTACWSCAGAQPFVANCSQNEIWKEFSSETQACTLIYSGLVVKALA